MQACDTPRANGCETRGSADRRCRDKKSVNRECYEDDRCRYHNRRGKDNKWLIFKLRESITDRQLRRMPVLQE